MNDIFTMLKILIFGGSTLLTPDPVDINTEILAIKPESSIEAITNGASLNIDVSQYILSEKMTDGFKEIKDKFPQGCITATLISEHGEKVVLNKSSGRWGGTKKMVNLHAENGVPTDIEFNKIELLSCKEIKNTKVTWYNYSK
jgi:hypothetical protein